MGAWINANWLGAITALGVIGTLVFTGITLREDVKSHRIQNHLLLTRSHRELWSELFYNKGLARILDDKADVKNEPPTREEMIFVNMVIQHLHSAHEATEKGRFVRPERVSKDVGQFFALPIPNSVWQNAKSLQNEDFVEFVESSRNV